MTRLALLAVLALAAPCAALAQPAADCVGFLDIGGDPAGLGLARVTGEDANGRLHFRADSRTGIPCAEVRCQARAYLLKGDEVVTGGRKGPFVCAWFKAKGRQVSYGSYGWLPAGALTPLPFPANPPLGAWAGRWVRDRELGLETALSVQPVKGRLKVSGTSLFAHSRAEVARGAVNDGEVDDVIDVRGRIAGMLLQPPTRGASPSAADDDCKVGMVLLGDWLVVADNNACGGLNVTFAGVYRHDR